MATLLKNSFPHQNTPSSDADTFSLLGQKVTYNEQSKSKNSKTSRFLYMFAYSLMVISLGCTETFGAAIYTELQSQLSVSTDIIAFIFMCKSIAFGISAIFSAWIIDYFIETHRYCSMLLLATSISVILIPFTHNLTFMYILFITIGIGFGANFVCFPVFVFRLYPSKQSLLIYALLCIYGISKVVLPLFVQLSISTTSQYYWALLLIVVLSLTDCIALLFAETPRHDKLRTIKADIANHHHPPPAAEHSNHLKSLYTHYSLETDGNISDDRTNSTMPTMSQSYEATNGNTFSCKLEQNDRCNHDPNSFIDESKTDTLMESQTELEDISNQVSFILRNNRQHVMYEWLIIVLLSIDITLFSSTQTGCVYFITSYCSEYLQVHEANGRYMISCYYLGQLVYRLLFALIFVAGGRYRSLYRPNRTILIGFAVCTVFALCFVIWRSRLVLIYVIYTVCGVFGGGIFPDVYKWCEIIKPVSGILSSFYIIGYSGGDALTVLIIGELFSRETAFVLPYAILIVNIIGLLFTTYVTMLYNKYERNKALILAQYYNRQ